MAVFVHGVHGGNWSRLWLHGSSFSLPPELIARTSTWPGVGYDGQFYRLAAHDPWLDRGYSKFMDNARYRRQRILLPALAWLSAAGRTGWIDATYIIWSLLFCVVGVLWSARLAMLFHHPPWWGLGFLVMPATVLSIHRMLLDGPFLALSLGAIYFGRVRRDGMLAATLAATCLCRETGVLIVAGILVSRALRQDWSGAAIAGASVLPFAGWSWWLATQVPMDLPHFLGLPPLAGLVERLFWARADGTPTAILRTIQATDVLSILGMGLAIFAAFVVWARDKRDPLSWTVILFAVLAALLRDPANVWIEVYAYGRTLGPLLGLLAIAAMRDRNWLLLVPTLMQYPRLGIEFASPALAILRNLTP